MFIIFLLTLKQKLQEGRIFLLFCILLQSQCIRQYLSHSSCWINIFEWMDGCCRGRQNTYISCLTTVDCRAKVMNGGKTDYFSSNLKGGFLWTWVGREGFWWYTAWLEVTEGQWKKVGISMKRNLGAKVGYKINTVQILFSQVINTKVQQA